MEDVELNPAPVAPALVADDPCKLSADPLIGEIAEAVEKAARGRVHQLKVEIVGQDVRLTGYCATFHCNQLAVAAAMHVAPELTIDNRIVVW